MGSCLSGDKAAKPSFSSKYKLLEELGSGAYATVRLAEDRSTGQKVAVKCVDRKKMDKGDEEGLMDEIGILREVNHNNAIKLYDHFETKPTHFIVLELMGGGELLQSIVKKERYSEGDARNVVKTLADVFSYIHGMGIVHRDLKAENVLLTDKTPSATVKLADFGFAKHVPDRGCVTACGTPGYVAPEIIGGKKYRTECDNWSLGVLTFILLAGYPPFYGDNRRELFRKIRNVNYDFASPYWDNISQEAKDLVSKMLTKDPKARINADQVLQHPWIKSEDNSKVLDEKNVYELSVFNARRRLREAFAAAVAAGRIQDLADMLRSDRKKE